eukprot:PITA_03347
MVEKRTGKSIKCLRTDNGGELTSIEFEQCRKDEGIIRHKTTVYTPQQNGVAERMNQSLMERSRSMISNGNLQKESWAEEVSPNQQVQLEARPFGDSQKEEGTSGEKGVEYTKEAIEVSDLVQLSEPGQQPVTLRRSTMERKTPKRYEDSTSSFALITKDGEPSCFRKQ